MKNFIDFRKKHWNRAFDIFFNLSRIDLEKITTSILEEDFTSIVERLKTSISKEKDVVEIFAEIITLQKLSQKNLIFFIVNWLKIEVNCHKFENKIMIKKRVMFEKLLLVFFLFFLFSDQRNFVLYFFRIFLFIFFFFISFFLFAEIVLLQQQHFVQKSDFFRFVILYLFCFRFSSHKASFEDHSLMFHSEETYFETISSSFFFNFFIYRFNFRFSFSVVALIFEVLYRSKFSFCFQIL